MVYRGTGIANSRTKGKPIDKFKIYKKINPKTTRNMAL